MRIKKLELVGFKSFKDRTVIHFDEGITGVVGPNGCGKSNIVDALVWVMGEMSAKHLRGSSMSDVIFAGAEGYAPMGMAEVSLTLENDGGPFPAKYLKHSEVMITRRLHRSGESEYLINRTPARLRDIQEIFMDTGAGSKGFSIIEQGAIGQMIVAKPQERRVLIEEAAGISKFKVRKRESQRKLMSTDQNLVRLQDIIGEQKRQLDSLQRQAQRAERYRNIKREAEEKDLLVSSKNYLSLCNEAESAAKELSEYTEKEVSVSSRLNELESDIQKLKLQVAEKEAELQVKSQYMGERKEATQKRETEIREVEFEIEQVRRDKKKTGSIVDQYKVRKEALDKDKASLDEKLKVAQSELSQTHKDHSEKEEYFNQSSQRIQIADDELTEVRRSLLAVSQSESHLEAKQISLDEKISETEMSKEVAGKVFQELNGKHSEFEKRHKTLFNQMEQHRQMQLDIMKDVDNFQENLGKLSEQVEFRRQEVANFKDSLNKVTSRLYGLENLHANFEGFQEGAKNIMLWQRKRQEISADGSVSESSEPVLKFKPVAEVIEVDEQYELAMEAALGARLQMLLSDNSQSSLRAVDYLKENKSGRSSFLSNDITSSTDLADPLALLGQEQGVTALLRDVVQIPEPFKLQVVHFIKDVAVVDSIRTALRLRANYPNFSFVTLEGDTLSAEGVLTGGTSESAGSGVLKRRREIKDLSLKREELTGKLALAEVRLKKLEAQFKSVSGELEQARIKQTEREIEMAEIKKDLERAENELLTAQSAVEKQKQELSEIETKLSEQKDSQTQLLNVITETKGKKAEFELKAKSLSRELSDTRSGIDQLQQEVSLLRARLAGKEQEVAGLTSQQEMVSKSLDEVNTELNKMTEETEKSTENLSSNQVLVEQLKVEFERMIVASQEAEAAVAKMSNEYEEVSSKCREAEESVSGELHELHEFKTKMSETQVKLEQLHMKKSYLVDQINERYMKSLSEVAPQYQNIEANLEEVDVELEELKGKLKRLGEVNLSAIEEYDDLTRRYEFLTTQHQDLLEAKEQLRKVIDRINRICSRRFKETFEQVNERFVKVFPVLFGGGEARLILVENEEKDEMGIEIVAKPPGKKLQNVSLLSGGEKALTAVSLIFSIFLVKPSPFCLLDEVDAPLDDANVYRFNDLVQEMAKRSQIIVVTHNKHTMKINNKLFGVTMEEKGVSKMVSVNLDQAQQVAEEV